MKRMYCIYDLKAQVYNAPFYALTDGAAQRDVMSNMGADSMLGKYPDDYRLCCVGGFEEMTGQVIGHEHPEVIAELRTLADMLAKES